MPIILLCIKKYVYHFLQHILHNYKLWQKFCRILKQMYIEKTECVPKDDFGPA